MNPLNTIRRQLLYVSSGLLILCLIFWLLFPYQSLIAGVMLGLCISLYNILYLTRKIRLKGEHSIVTSLKMIQGSGMLNRYLMVTLAIIIAILYPQWIDVRTVVIGLPICYILVVVLETISILRQEKSSRKG